MKKAMMLLIGCFVVFSGCIPVSPTLARPSNTPKILPSVTNQLPTLTRTIQPSNTPLPQNTITPTLLPTDTLLPTQTEGPTDLPFPTPHTAVGVQQKCFPILDEIPTGFSLKGTLLFDNRSLTTQDEDMLSKTYDLASGKEQRIADSAKNGQQVVSIYDISPDGNWILYFVLSDDQNMIAPHLLSVDGNEKAVVGWVPDWGKVWGSRKNHFADISWLDNHRIVITLEANVIDTPHYAHLVIWDPFTGASQDLKLAPPSGLSLDNPDVIINPSLTRAAYYSMSSYFLWDLTTRKDVGHPSNGLIYSAQWSPDGKILGLIVYGDGKQGNAQNIRTMQLDGTITKATYFEDLFPEHSVYLTHLTWSPNGRYIASLIHLYDEGGPFSRSVLGPDLEILDTQTGQLLNTCLVADEYAYPMAVWSLDSQQIAITMPKDLSEYAKPEDTRLKKNTVVVIVDLQKQNAIRLPIYNFSVSGWLNVHQ